MATWGSAHNSFHGSQAPFPRLQFLNQETNVKFRLASVLVAALMSAGVVQAQTELVIATVNNGHMIEMQKLGKHFESANPDIKLKWVTL
jgi:hypothetical protein